MVEASQLVGTFEKPLYVTLQKNICAHSRVNQPACSNCLNVCPTGAITSTGEHVAVDPMICAGWGACSAVCPSGAISYDAPSVNTVFRKITSLAFTFTAAGGTSPSLLVHDTGHGREMIALSARFGRSLPPHVVPLEVAALSGFGHAEMLAALACAFGRVDILLSPTNDRDVIEAELETPQLIAGVPKISVLDLNDLDQLSETLYSVQPQRQTHKTILPLGNRRKVKRLAAKTQRREDEIFDLPKGAPYGALAIDKEACTLCLSCVSPCPPSALLDNEDKPQLRFQEDACLQCGLCTKVCPENALSLVPQLKLNDPALGQTVLNGEEPYEGIECGAPFGVKSTVERILEQLAGKHSMVAISDAAKMIQMCDDCRVPLQFHAEATPFAMGTPRRP